MSRKIYILTMILISFINCYAQKFEAETATLSGGAVKQANSKASGGFIVAQNDGKLSFNLNIPETGYYNVYVQVAAPSGEKTNLMSVDGTSISFYTPKNSNYIHLKVISSIKLSGGSHLLEIIKSWGWINIDYIELEKVDPNARFNTNTSLVTPNPTDETIRRYRFLYAHYGKKIISGIM